MKGKRPRPARKAEDAAGAEGVSVRDSAACVRAHACEKVVSEDACVCAFCIWESACEREGEEVHEGGCVRGEGCGEPLCVIGVLGPCKRRVYAMKAVCMRQRLYMSPWGRGWLRRIRGHLSGVWVRNVSVGALRACAEGDGGL